MRGTYILRIVVVTVPLVLLAPLLLSPILGGLHIQFRRIQIFLLFYFYSFNIVFEDKPSAVLAS